MLKEEIKKYYRIESNASGVIIKKPTIKESKKAQVFYDKYLAGDVDAPTFVAVVDGDLVGAIWLHSFYFPKMERDINEFDVIVHPDWKRKGIAKQLINKVKTTSKLPLIAKPSTKEGIKLIKSLDMKHIDHEYYGFKNE